MSDAKIIEVMMYDDFIKSKIIKHNDLVDNLKDGIKYLTDSNAESISFNIQKKIKFTDIDVLEVDKNDNYIYTYDIYTYNYKKQADIIDNIHFVASNKNIKMIFIIGGYEYDNINTFISILSQYNEFKLKFIFTEKPNINDEICLYYRNYLLNDVDINQLINTKLVETDTNKYFRGFCLRISEYINQDVSYNNSEKQRELMYDDFIKSKMIKHNDLIDNYQDGMKYLNETDNEIISYNTHKKIKFFNVNALTVDKNNNYIYIYNFERRSGDVVNNIKFVSSSNKNIKMIFILGGVEYDNINTYIHALSSYHNLQLKFIFTEKPNIDDEICLYYENYLLNYFNLHKLRNCQIVQTNTNVYLHGLTGRIEECNDIRIKHNYENLTSRVY